ncbi:hypothetical protein LTR64_008395 [Lithohypha guttulata]|uniref:uncharacterized protein n=1 Tax=Lithohypha guttulata TaxID=1690604 RepID=UPI00315DC4CD
MAFLVKHAGQAAASGLNQTMTKKPFRILFDLGLRHSEDRYCAATQEHLQNRRAYKLQQGAAAQLASGDLHADDMDLILLSHVHYDHHGDPKTFPKSTFVVDPPRGMGSHQHFDPDLLPLDRVIKLSSPADRTSWKPLGPSDASLDVFGDGTVYVLDAPDHLPGHINLLCRTRSNKFVCLSGDAFHDRRLLDEDRDFAHWETEVGHRMCIHTDPAGARQTLQKVKVLASWGVEVISAHDHEWLKFNQHNMFPDTI